MLLDDLLTRSAGMWADVDAIRERQRSVTLSAFSAEVDAWTGRLGDLIPGERVSVVSHNRIGYAALYFAVARLGGITVAHNWRLLPAELAEQIRDADACIVIADSHGVAALDAHREALPQVRSWVDLDGATEGSRPRAESEGWQHAEALAAHGAVPRLADEDEVVVMMYTSGTTGRSKAAMLTHRNLCHMVLAWSVEMPLRAGETRFLQVTPLFHVGGLMMVLLNVAHGSTLLLEPDFQPGDAVRRLQHDRATHALLVPAMIKWLLIDPAMRGASFPDLELILYGASPMPVADLRQAIEVFGCGFLHAYGLTETSGVVTALRPAEHVHALAHEPTLLASAGRPMVGCAVRVVAPDGTDVPVGALGEVICRGPNVFVGYRDQPAATAEALREQAGLRWLWTGDIGRLDSRGYLMLVDRSKDMIIVGGENVYPSEVETALRGVTGVRDIAVIGIPHAVWGEQVLAIVVAEEDAEELPQRLIEHARAQLARFKCPTRVELVDSLPRTPAGKVQKAVLRAPYWAGRDRAI